MNRDFLFAITSIVLSGGWCAIVSHGWFVGSASLCFSGRELSVLDLIISSISRVKYSVPCIALHPTFWFVFYISGYTYALHCYFLLMPFCMKVVIQYSQLNSRGVCRIPILHKHVSNLFQILHTLDMHTHTLVRVITQHKNGFPFRCIC